MVSLTVGIGNREGGGYFDFLFNTKQTKTNKLHWKNIHNLVQ